MVLVYGAVWWLFQQVQPPYRKTLTVGATLYSSLEGKKLEFFTRHPQVGFRSFRRPAFEALLSPEGLDANTAFLLTLILITPGMRLRNRGVWLAAGLGLIYLSQVAFLLVKSEISLIKADHPLAGSIFFWETADNFFEITGKGFFPIAIWICLTFQYLLGKVDHPQPIIRKPVKRNDPCPCGSGKKYKHCCGR